MAIDPYSDGSGNWRPEALGAGMNFKDFGSYGLRQYGGWVREEFLTQLIGQRAATAYREMMDNSATVGAMIFATTQAMRRVDWRVEPVDDSAKAKKYAEFADSLRLDMSHSWEDFITEALSMLGYGFSFHELVYKRRTGLVPELQKYAQRSDPALDEIPSSLYSDGLIGWRRMPIRGQDTVLKWFFDSNGQIRGMTQQPWVGTLIDIPIEKGLLFRPSQHKNNPEGRSILRNAYRSYYFIKRLEELEAILFERMAGFPIMYVPNKLLEAATAIGAGFDANAAATLAYFKKMVTNIRIDEQMGAIIPSDVYRDSEGKPTAQRMYQFELVTPSGGSKSSMDSDEIIDRHQVEILMTILCDFIQMGHDVRGTNNLAMTKVDMFYAAIEGWLDSIAGVINRYALPRIWALNGFDMNYMPKYVPDMPQRLDLDGLGMFIANLANAGMPMFPDEELQEYLRDAAGLPEITSPEATALVTSQPENMRKMLLAAVAKRIIVNRQKKAKR